jgi:hypothetical protein
MSILIKFVLGTVRGMGGPDLQAWIDNLPGKIGEEFGGIVRFNLDPSGRLTETGRKRLEDALVGKSVDQVSEILPTLVPRSDSVLSVYLTALNLVVATLREGSYPIVVRGFIHSPNVVSYWHFDSKRGSQLIDFTVRPDGDSIACSFQLKIHLLDGLYEDSDRDTLNVQIRKVDTHDLNKERLKGSVRVKTIREFKIEGVRDFERVPIPAKPIEIPDGAPGIPIMLASVDRAIAKQAEVQAAFRSTLDKTKSASHKRS